jgi:5,10-methylenetetrahydrofolate reductase
MRGVGALGLHRRCHILIGVGPIASARAARWLNARVPGVNIPDTIIRRLEAACDPRAEGRRICIEMIQGVRAIDGVAGVHILAPKQEEAVAEIVAASGVLGQRVPLFHHLSAGPSIPTSISELRL